MLKRERATSERRKDRMTGPWCAAEEVCTNGRDRRGVQGYRGQRCQRSFTKPTGTPLARPHFPADIIAPAVKWYLRYCLSYADTAELLVERGICVDSLTINDWMQRFTPLYQDAARRYRYPVGRTWSSVSPVPPSCQIQSLL